MSPGPGRGRAGDGGVLVHHELCFGCGRLNLFGLLLEVEPTGPGAVAGRCFIKQDHQGAERGAAHEGVLAAALSESMALACGLDARAVALELTLDAPAPVGAYVEIEARVESRDGEIAHATAVARADQRMVAQARGRFRF
jgi:acyl-coenzyme A thioesterase PaaI-like protein